MILFAFLVYYKYQSKTLSDWPVLHDTPSAWSTKQVTYSVIYRNTDRGTHGSVQQNVVIVNQSEDIMIRGRTNEHLSIQLLQYISNVSIPSVNCYIACI